VTELSRTRFDHHLSRKFFHILAGTIIAILFVTVFSRKHSILLMVASAVVLITLELFRFASPKVNAVVLRVYGPLMRKSEESNPSAQLYFILGLVWATVFLPKAIALQAILTLAWMDPAAGVVGVRFGKRTWNAFLRKIFVDSRVLPIDLGAKTMEGSAAGFLAALLAGIIAWTGPWASFATEGSRHWPSAGEVALLSVVGATAAIIAEAWPSQWDDNANIPFWTGLIVWMTAMLANIPVPFN